MMIKDIRLLDTLVPTKYEIEIDIDEKKVSFSGFVRIYASLTEVTKAFSLHSVNLNIESVSVLQSSKPCKMIFEIDENSGLLNITSLEEFSTEPLEIICKFNSMISESMVGLYPAKYEIDDEEFALFTTQLESHHAREVFPCIDEPAAKAIFSLALTTKSESVNLSNMLPLSTQEQAGRTTTIFADTPVMSTYLLAFMSGNLKYLEANTASGFVVRTWATPDKYKKTQYALDIAVKSLDLMEEFFDEPYPLEKCDLVAVPEFASGAMENWGLITYREIALLVDENTKIAEKQLVAQVVTHELAHQWFGNLVTMEWWNDLWLNESFASFMEYYVLNQLYPEWNMMMNFVSEEIYHAQDMDRLHSTHSIEVEIKDPDQIRTVFDAISYEKGSIIIGMILGFIGEEAFREGLRAYIKKHKYGNTTTKDLWQAWSDSSSVDVVSFASSWTTQPGFPVVTVSSDNTSVKLSQKRYFLDGKSSSDQLWTIPLFLSGEHLHFDSPEIEYKKAQPSKPINNNQSAFYLTHYDDNTLKNLLKGFADLPGEEQVGILQDLFMLSKSGDTTIRSSLDAMPLAASSTSAALWGVVLGELWSIHYNFIEHESDEDKAFDAKTRDLVIQQYDRLGWDAKKDDTIDDETLRSMMLHAAVGAEHDPATKIARKLSDLAPDKLSPHARNTVLKYLIKSEPGAHKNLRVLYKQTNSPALRRSLHMALTSSRDDANIESNIEMIMQGEVRLQDVLSWLGSLLRVDNARDKTWVWIRENWPQLKKRFGNDTMSLVYMPLIAGATLKTNKHLQEFDVFFDQSDFKKYSLKVSHGREILSWRVGWIENNFDEIKQWLLD